MADGVRPITETLRVNDDTYHTAVVREGARAVAVTRPFDSSILVEGYVRPAAYCYPFGESQIPVKVNLRGKRRQRRGGRNNKCSAQRFPTNLRRRPARGPRLVIHLAVRADTRDIQTIRIPRGYQRRGVECPVLA